MNSVQFIESIADWLLADPAHIVVAASVIAALTPTPDPASAFGKIYRLLDLLALNILRAKDTAATPPSAPAPAATAAAMPAVASGQTGATPAKSGQAGFSRLPLAILVALAGALLGLSGCAGVQATVAAANAQAVQVALAAGKDQMTLGKELLCSAPYQTVANAMAADKALATALPGLCPAVISVPVPAGSVPTN